MQHLAEKFEYFTTKILFKKKINDVVRTLTQYLSAANKSGICQKYKIRQKSRKLIFQTLFQRQKLTSQQINALAIREVKLTGECFLKTNFKIQNEQFLWFC